MARFRWTNKRILAGIALLTVIAAGVASLRLLFPSLPSPARANREQLLRWIVAQDLAEHPAQIHTDLARRLEQEFQHGVDWNDLGNRLSESQRQQLWRNIPLLLEAWLRDKANAYARLPAAERTNLVDRVLDMLATWRGADQVRPQSSSTSPSKSADNLLTLFQRQMSDLDRRTESPERERISELLWAIQMRSLVRELRL